VNIDSQSDLPPELRADNFGALFEVLDNRSILGNLCTPLQLPRRRILDRSAPLRRLVSNKRRSRPHAYRIRRFATFDYGS